MFNKLLLPALHKTCVGSSAFRSYFFTVKFTNMSQKTAMKVLVDYMIENYHLTDESLLEFEKALEEEKKQIISFGALQLQQVVNSDVVDMFYKKSIEESFNETYKND